MIPSSQNLQKRNSNYSKNLTHRQTEQILCASFLHFPLIHNNHIYPRCGSNYCAFLCKKTQPLFYTACQNIYYSPALRYIPIPFFILLLSSFSLLFTMPFIFFSFPTTKKPTRAFLSHAKEKWQSFFPFPSLFISLL